MKKHSALDFLKKSEWSHEKHHKFVHIAQIAIKITFKLPKIVKKGCHRKLHVHPDVCGRECSVAPCRSVSGWPCCGAVEGHSYEHKAESLR